MHDPTGRNVVVEFKPRPGTRLDRAVALLVSGNCSREVFAELCQLFAGGELEASFYIGLFHETGLGGVKRDPIKAFTHFSIAARELDHVEAWLGVARLLYYGVGVQKDVDGAYGIYARVAEHASHPVAHLMYGLMLMRGQGVEKDLSAARRWITSAVEAGNVPAMVALSKLEAKEGNWHAWFAWRVRAVKELLRHRRIAYDDITMRSC